MTTTPLEQDTTPLLAEHRDAADVPSYGSSPTQSDEPAGPVQVQGQSDASSTNKAWILAGLWSAVFLGALDGWPSVNVI